MPYTTIDSPKKYFEAKTYTGNGSSQTISGLQFSPDFVWGKNRTVAYHHVLTDIVRGATKCLFSSTTDAEVTDAQRLSSFTSDGFSVGNDASLNGNGNSQIAWCWDANGTGSSNTSGTITSTVSANTTSGFSIVSYTGDGVNNRTVGHGLGVTPKFIIIKNRDNGTAYWSVINPRSTSTTDTNMLYLNRTDAEADDTNIMGTNLPNSTTFGIGNYSGVNVNGNKHIAYCFAEVKGFSKFGSYTGNGNADGTFVYTGFAPAWVMIKNSSNAGEYWQIIDNKRDTFNVTYKRLFPNVSDAENTALNPNIDILSNGFKCRTASSGTNGAYTFIYMAFAENPFVTSKGLPVCAR